MTPSTAAKPGMPSSNASARRLFTISQRQPWHLPDDEIELAAPAGRIEAPPRLNWITTLLPPSLMLVGTIVSSFFGTNGLLVAVPMLLMSLGFPLASILSFAAGKKKHAAALQAREAAYRQVLGKQYALIQEYAGTQHRMLHREYPALEELEQVVMQEPERRERLWLRRPHDVDFLSLRLGLAPMAPAFKVIPPRSAAQDDPLNGLAAGILKRLETLPDLPALVPMAQVGSLVVTGRSLGTAYGAARRLLLEVLVHHSPQDVQVVVLADSDNAHERWDWLKWSPHCLALEGEEFQRRIAFNNEDASALLEWLTAEFKRRKPANPNANKPGNAPALFVLLDDAGRLRATPAVAQLAGEGWEAGIYLLFAGGQNWPRDCRARLECTETDFHYIETWGGAGGGITRDGKLELAGIQESERITRTLAGLQVSGARSSAALPDSIRISEVLGPGSLYVETIKERWARPLEAREQLQFPVGVTVSREAIEPFLMDLRPESLGGKQAFHSVLIGTTGSGKSVFLQSLVLGAAYAYSPRHLNFLLMDFKAGASELGKLRELPHVVGLVTDLGPDLAQRALVAIDSEIQRRKRIFEDAGKISDIWTYNQRFPEEPLPHLLLVLDEFSKGVELLPDMQRVLQTLATQGRALGMYLLLANQKVNSAVDALLANIGWRIALRVAEREEMRIVDPSLTPTRRPGRGYVRVKEDVIEIQGARSDQPVAEAEEDSGEFTIHQVQPDGARLLLYKHSPQTASKAADQPAALSEVETFVKLMKQAAQELGIKPSRPIYTDPLPARISLEETIAEAEVPAAFQGSAWSGAAAGALLAPCGYVDIPQDCLQQPLKVDFSDQDGHLWVIGAPGSGKEMALTTLLLSLAATHTPEQVQFYILEYGGGSLRPFESLPHTGAVIRPEEQERLERLLTHLEAELERRNSASSTDVGAQLRGPALFLVINNFAELRQTYPDHAERLARFVRLGRSAGIHMLISSSRSVELTRSVASNIARRLVFQLASRDEYIDAVGRSVSALTDAAEGRGYWVDGAVVECQLAQPALTLEPGGETLDVRTIGKSMRAAWSGPLPPAITTLADCIPLEEMLAKFTQPQDAQAGFFLPVGVSNESLQVLKPNLLEELPQWLILGPRQSGKSNFLACAGESLLRSGQPGWQTFIIALRRSPLAEWGKQHPEVHLAVDAAQALDCCKDLAARLDAGGAAEERFLLMIDDLGAAFEIGRESVGASLNQLAARLGSSSNVFLLAAGMLDELRSQMTAPLVRLLRQSRTGMGLTRDTSELDWLGFQPSLQMRKVELPPGRGFWVTRGRGHLVQAPLLNDCPKGKGDRS